MDASIKSKRSSSRTKCVRVRASLEEVAAWKSAAAAAGLTVSDFLRINSGRQTRKHIPRLDPQLVFQVNKAGVALNQIASHLNLGEPFGLKLVTSLLTVERQLAALLEDSRLADQD